MIVYSSDKNFGLQSEIIILDMPQSIKLKQLINVCAHSAAKYVILPGGKKTFLLYLLVSNNTIL